MNKVSKTLSQKETKETKFLTHEKILHKNKS